MCFNKDDADFLIDALDYNISKLGRSNLPRVEGEVFKPFGTLTSLLL